jgi:hypothetical protein
MMIAFFLVLTLFIMVGQCFILAYNLSENKFTSKSQVRRLLIPWYGMYHHLTYMAEHNGQNIVKAARQLAQHAFRGSPAIQDEKMQEAEYWARMFIKNGLM